MKKPPFKKAVLGRLAELYARMDAAYATSAAAIGLSCAGCADNCCESHFRHHTYIEWLDLAAGFAALPEARRKDILAAAEEWLRIHQGALPGMRPRVPCPLCISEGGALSCGLYAHRPMVCRLHGVPNVLKRPDGQQAAFPGCDRAQDLARTCEPALLDRTPLLTEMARLEMDLLGRERMAKLPRVDLSIAEMLLMGAPKI
jgi:Fe-S-cluster containining protein